MDANFSVVTMVVAALNLEKIVTSGQILRMVALNRKLLLTTEMMVTSPKTTVTSGKTI